VQRTLPTLLAAFALLGCENQYCQSGAKYGTQCYSGDQFRGNAAGMTEQEVETELDRRNSPRPALAGVIPALQMAQRRNTVTAPPSGAKAPEPSPKKRAATPVATSTPSTPLNVMVRTRNGVRGTSIDAVILPLLPELELQLRARGFRVRLVR
jgi:hypothetical protein